MERVLQQFGIIAGIVINTLPMETRSWQQFDVIEAEWKSNGKAVRQFVCRPGKSPEAYGS